MAFPTTPDISSGDFGRASWADDVVADLTGLAFAEFPLGGSLENSIPGGTAIACYEPRGVCTHDSTYTDNFVWTLSVFMKVAASGSVIAIIKDDLGATTHTFSAHTSTSLIEQRFEFTPDPARTYYLYFTNSNDPIEAYGYGKVVRSAVSLP